MAEIQQAGGEVRSCWACLLFNRPRKPHLSILAVSVAIDVRSQYSSCCYLELLAPLVYNQCLSEAAASYDSVVDGDKIVQVAIERRAWHPIFKKSSPRNGLATSCGCAGPGMAE